MFNGINCKGMISQFKVVKSLTNKKQTLDGQAKIGLKIYLDAAKLLGVEIDESNIYKVDKNGKFIIGADKRPEMSEDFKGFWMQIYGEGKDKKVRNFIVNNVISSDRFFYLIKYCNAGTCRKYAQSEKLVDLVLRRLPDSQIDRYTKIIAPNTKAGESKRSVLAKEIMSLDFNYIFNNKKAISTEGNDKIRMQCLVSLYMTVIYIATKNLVKANARYFIAFSCLDRDYDLFNMLTAHQKENADGTIETRYEVGDYLALTEKFLSEEHYKTRVKEYLKGNLSEAKTLPAGVFSCYRNFISHMTAVTNAYKYIGEMNAEDKISYYSIFNYILQRYLNEVYIDSKNALPEWYKSCMQKVEQYHSYNKDVIKILNMPFAYNLPRYKNLSVEYLFNDLDNEAQKEQKRKEEKRKGK